MMIQQPQFERQMKTIHSINVKDVAPAHDFGDLLLLYRRFIASSKMQ